MSTTGENASTDEVEPGNDTGGERGSEAGERSGTGRGAERLPLDVVFDILRNERRRRVLTYLDERDGEVALGDLAEYVAAVENGVTVADLSTQQRKRVYVGLYQSHLPKMAEAGVIEFEKDRGLIRSGPALDQLRPYLDAHDGADGIDPWHAVLGAAAVVGYVLPAVGGFAGTVAGGVVVVAALAAYGGANWPR